MPYWTADTWSLEGAFCRDRRQGCVAIVGGDAALTRGQARSSAACFAAGLILYLLLPVSVLVSLGTPPAIVAVVVVMFVACWCRRIR